MTEVVPVITLDGPSAAGKGTISQMLAQHLGWHLLDSGALYRVLALAANQHGVDLDQEQALEVLAAHLDVQFLAAGAGRPSRVILEGEDVTDNIRSEKYGNKASKVARFRAVRRALLNRQRDFRVLPGLVADGRDMGTVVFPDAKIKFFLTASPESRALRRYLQLKEKGINGKLDALVKELRERDVRDQERAVAPLKPADGAIYIDTTQMNIEQVYHRVLEYII